MLNSLFYNFVVDLSKFDKLVKPDVMSLPSLLVDIDVEYYIRDFDTLGLLYN